MQYTIIRDAVAAHTAAVEYDGHHHQDHPAYARTLGAWRDQATSMLVLHVEYERTPDGEYAGGTSAEVWDEDGGLITETPLDGMRCDPVAVLLQTYQYSLDDCDDLSMEPAQTLHRAGYLEGVDPPRGWWADDGGGATHYPDAEDGEDAARRYVEDGSWDLESTIWHRVWTWPDGESREDGGERHRIAQDPTAPDCAGAHEHDWCSPHEVLGGLAESPGVVGHGGGVVIREVCRHCGCYRITDTWAQDPVTGEQGLESVHYEEADEASRAWISDDEGEGDA